MPVFHVELRRFPHSARAFNLGADELERRFLSPWRRGSTVQLGERQWEPARTELKVLEGRELRADELAMGRGWQNAVRACEEVTGRLLAAGESAGAVGASPGAAEFREAVLAQCGGGRIGLHQVIWLANGRYPEARVSERLALAEQAVWELLHHGRLRMLGPDGVVEQAGWQHVLLAWGTWADPAAPAILLERADGGR